jgi:hypothetical protein
MSQVSVRRGSITTTRSAGLARLAASRRWNSTGWHQARLLPTRTTSSASSKSSYRPGTVSLPKTRLWPATDEAMQSRELVSMLAVPMKPLISLLAT